MRVMTKFSIGVALVGSVLLALSAGAQAQDHWDRDHNDRDRHYDRRNDHNDRYDRYHHERFVEERPVYVAPRAPVIVAPPPVYMAPPVMMAPPGPPSLNLNFNVPL